MAESDKLLKQKNPGGRPTKYNEEIAERICEAVAINDMGLAALVAQNEWMPESSTIRLWRFKHDGFSAQYTKAKQFQSELYAESTHEIAQEKAYFIDAEGNKKIDPGYVAWQKMNVNLRQWHASKLAPKIYGDKKMDETVSNNDALNKIKELVADLNKSNPSDV